MKDNQVTLLSEDGLQEDILFIRSLENGHSKLTIIRRSDLDQMSQCYGIHDREIAINTVMKNSAIPKWHVENYADLCRAVREFPEQAAAIGQYYYNYGNYCHKEGLFFGLIKKHRLSSPLFFQTVNEKSDWKDFFCFEKKTPR